MPEQGRIKHAKVGQTEPDTYSAVRFLIEAHLPGVHATI